MASRCDILRLRKIYYVKFIRILEWDPKPNNGEVDVLFKSDISSAILFWCGTSAKSLRLPLGFFTHVGLMSITGAPSKDVRSAVVLTRLEGLPGMLSEVLDVVSFPMSILSPTLRSGASVLPRFRILRYE